jgi:hypothetical protein
MSEYAKIVATGVWFYDRTVPKPIKIYAKPARFAYSRYDADEQLIETSPIPETKDGFLYYCFPGKSGEHLSVEEAKEWADLQPWGPVKWDD